MKRPAFVHFWIVLFAFIMTACGGGGESSALSVPGQSTDYVLDLNASGGPISGNTPVQLTATLRTSAGTPVPGAKLSFATNVGRLTITTAQTDSSGMASVPLYAGSAGYNTGTVAVGYRDPAQNFAMKTIPVITEGNQTTDPNQPVPAAEPKVVLTIVDHTGAVVDAAHPIMDSSPGKLKAVVTLSDGSPAAGVIVVFGFSGSGGDFASIEQTTALTDAAGRAETAVSSRKVGAGIATVVASVGEKTATDSRVFATAFLPEGTPTTGKPAIELIVLGANGQPVNASNPLTDTAPGKLRAVVKKKDGSVASSVVVTFSADSALALSQATVLTNSSGVAEISVTAQDSGAGFAGASATVDGVAVTGSTVFSAIVSTSADATKPTVTLTAVAANNQMVDASNPITDKAPGKLRALVKKKDGTVAAGVVVTFAPGSIATVSQGTMLTNSSGIAEVTITATSAGAGIAEASATVDGVTVKGTVALATARADTDTTKPTVVLTALAANGQVADASNPILDTAPGKLRAEVKKKDGSIAAGVLVTFSAPGNLAKLSQATALTNAGGVAEVVITATGTGAGAVNATVSVENYDIQATALFAATLAVPQDGLKPTITVTVLGPTGGSADSTNPITDTAPGKLRAVLRKADGSVAPNVVVNFSIDGALAALSQATMLTNASGVAEVSVTAKAAGAGIAGASATIDSVAVTGSAVFASSLETVSRTVLNLGYVGVGFTAGALGTNAVGPVDPGSTVLVHADVWDVTASARYNGNPVEVRFSSLCASNGRATIDAAALTDAQGRATATYRPSGCVGTDTITATLVNGGQTMTARVVLNMAAEQPSSISFVGASSEDLALRGSGTAERLEWSVLTFKVVGEQGNALANQAVCFGLSTTVGGVDNAPKRSSTNQLGLVTTTVVSGTVPTPLRVSAWVDTDTADENCATNIPSPLVQTVSSKLSISTGLPHQRSFSLSMEAPGNEKPAYKYDNVVRTVTLLAADRFHNPVPDGTTINFWTELGAITPSCNTDNGICTAQWRSQSPRTSGDGGRCGRSTILAYAVGEESFIDANGNGYYDYISPGNEFIWDQLGEVIKDINGNNALDSNEEFVDFDGDGVWDAPNSLFDGVLCGSGGNCSGRASVHVRAYHEVVMSTNKALLYLVHPNVDMSAVVPSVGVNCAATLTGIVNPADANYDYAGQVVTTIRVGDPELALKANAFRLLATDINGNQLAPGTKITLSIAPSDSKVTVEKTGGFSDSYTLTAVSGENDWFDELFFLKVDKTSDIDAVLRATVEHTDGIREVFDLAIIDRD